MPLDYDGYRIFYYVGKFGNITHAANALFLSQSTVSRAIQNLEHSLGCKLFERSQQGVTLTTEGKLLFSHVAQANEHLNAAEERVKAMQNESGGTIHIGVSDFTFRQYVLPIIKPFKALYPGVHIEVSSVGSNTNESITQSLESNLIDLACVCSPFLPTDKTMVEEITEFTEVMIAGPQFSELQHTEMSITEIVAKYPLASLSNGADGISYLERMMASHGIRIDTDYKVNSVSLFFPLVSQGLCLALVPTPALNTYKELYSFDYIPVTFTETLPPRKVCLVTSKTMIKNPAVEEFIRELKLYIRNCNEI